MGQRDDGERQSRRSPNFFFPLLRLSRSRSCSAENSVASRSSQNYTSCAAADDSSSTRHRRASVLDCVSPARTLSRATASCPLTPEASTIW